VVSLCFWLFRFRVTGPYGTDLRTEWRTGESRNGAHSGMATTKVTDPDLKPKKLGYGSLDRVQRQEKHERADRIWERPTTRLPEATYLADSKSSSNALSGRSWLDDPASLNTALVSRLSSSGGVISDWHSIDSQAASNWRPYTCITSPVTSASYVTVTWPKTRPIAVQTVSVATVLSRAPAPCRYNRHRTQKQRKSTKMIADWSRPTFVQTGYRLLLLHLKRRMPLPISD